MKFTESSLFFANARTYSENMAGLRSRQGLALLQVLMLSTFLAILVGLALSMFTPTKRLSIQSREKLNIDTLLNSIMDVAVYSVRNRQCLTGSLQISSGSACELLGTSDALRNQINPNLTLSSSGFVSYQPASPDSPLATELFLNPLIQLSGSKLKIVDRSPFLEELRVRDYRQLKEAKISGSVTTLSPSSNPVVLTLQELMKAALLKELQYEIVFNRFGTPSYIPAPNTHRIEVRVVILSLTTGKAGEESESTTISNPGFDISTVTVFSPRELNQMALVMKRRLNLSGAGVGLGSAFSAPFPLIARDTNPIGIQFEGPVYLDQGILLPQQKQNPAANDPTAAIRFQRAVYLGGRDKAGNLVGAVGSFDPTPANPNRMIATSNAQIRGDHTFYGMAQGFRYDTEADHGLSAIYGFGAGIGTASAGVTVPSSACINLAASKGNSENGKNVKLLLRKKIVTGNRAQMRLGLDNPSSLSAISNSNSIATLTPVSNTHLRRLQFNDDGQLQAIQRKVHFLREGTPIKSISVNENQSFENLKNWAEKLSDPNNVLARRHLMSQVQVHAYRKQNNDYKRIAAFDLTANSTAEMVLENGVTQTTQGDPPQTVDTINPDAKIIIKTYPVINCGGNDMEECLKGQSGSDASAVALDQFDIEIDGQGFQKVPESELFFEIRPITERFSTNRFGDHYLISSEESDQDRQRTPSAVFVGLKPQDAQLEFQIAQTPFRNNFKHHKLHELNENFNHFNDDAPPYLNPGAGAGSAKTHPEEIKHLDLTPLASLSTDTLTQIGAISQTELPAVNTVALSCADISPDAPPTGIAVRDPASQARDAWTFTPDQNHILITPERLPQISNFNSNDPATSDSFTSRLVYSHAQRYRNCTIDPSTDKVSGFFFCNKLIIPDRDKELTIRGTFIVDDLDVHANAIKNGIRWSSIWEPEAVRDLQSWGVINPVGTCHQFSDRIKAFHPWNPRLSKIDVERSQQCSPLFLRGFAQPFQWTSVEPQCAKPSLRDNGPLLPQPRCVTRLHRWNSFELHRKVRGL